MRVVVLSDTHGRVERIKKVIEQQPQAELFIFLGMVCAISARRCMECRWRSGVSVETVILAPMRSIR